MLRLKDIAAAMDDCHLRTATRWWKKLDAECRAAGLPGVSPDVTGHGADKWLPATAERLLRLWRDYYRQRGITPREARDKFTGKAVPPIQPLALELFAWATANPHKTKHGKDPSSSKRILTQAMGRTVPRRKERGDLGQAQGTRARGVTA